jgi:hypothetical protein
MGEPESFIFNFHKYIHVFMHDSFLVPFPLKRRECSLMKD